MSFLRSYVAPFVIVLIFAIAMLAVSVRIFLPGDMLAPAPIATQDSPDISQQGQIQPDHAA